RGGTPSPSLPLQHSKASPFAAVLARAHGFGPIWRVSAVTKTKKAALWPFPKRVGVGTYRPHPLALAAGCLLRKPWGRKIGAAAALVHPVSPKVVFSQGAQWLIAGWSSPVARQAHNLKVASSNLAPATKFDAEMHCKEGRSLGRPFVFVKMA